MSGERGIDRAAGVLLLAMVGLTVGGFVTGATLAEVDPFARGDVEKLLRTINGNFGVWSFSLVAYMATDVLVVATGAMLYVVFRDRSRTLAVLGGFALVAAAVSFMVHEVGAMTLAFLAEDFLVSGGAGTIAPADPVILETARAVSVAQALTALFGQTLMGLGIASIGALMIWAPAGLRNPPRWIGATGVLGGLFMVSTWVFLVNHLAGGAVTLIAELAVVVMLVGLGGWLLRQPAPSSAHRREPLTGVAGTTE